MKPRLLVYCDAGVQFSLAQVQSFLEAMIPDFASVAEKGGGGGQQGNSAFEVSLNISSSAAGGGDPHRQIEEAIKAVEECEDQSKYLEMTEEQFAEVTKLGLGAAAQVGKKRGRPLLRATQDDSELRPPHTAPNGEAKSDAETKQEDQQEKDVGPSVAAVEQPTVGDTDANGVKITFVQCPLDASHSVPIETLVDHLTLAHSSMSLLEVPEATSFIPAPKKKNKEKEESVPVAVSRMQQAMYGEPGAAPPATLAPAPVATAPAQAPHQMLQQQQQPHGGQQQQPPAQMLPSTMVIAPSQQPVGMMGGGGGAQAPAGVTELHLGYQEGQDAPQLNTVREFFAPFCAAVVVRHIRSKFCFFVGFTNAEEAQKAYKSVGRTLSMGPNCQLKVGWARAKQPQPQDQMQPQQQPAAPQQNFSVPQYDVTPGTTTGPGGTTTLQQQQPHSAPSAAAAAAAAGPGASFISTDVVSGSTSNTVAGAPSLQRPSMGQGSGIQQQAQQQQQQQQQQLTPQQQQLLQLQQQAAGLQQQQLIGQQALHPQQQQFLPNPQQQLGMGQQQQFNPQIQQQLALQQQLLQLQQQQQQLLYGGGGSGLQHLQGTQSPQQQQQKLQQQQQQQQQHQYPTMPSVGQQQKQVATPNGGGAGGRENIGSPSAENGSPMQSSTLLQNQNPSSSSPQSSSNNSKKVLAFSNLPSQPPTSERSIFLRLHPFVPMNISIVGPCAFCEFGSPDEAVDAFNFVRSKTLGGVPVQVQVL